MEEWVREQKEKMCRKYVADGKPQKTDSDKGKYDICCKRDYYCEVWAQSWFWWTIGGVILLLILISVAGCVWCCCLRKRSQGGGGDGNEGHIEKVEKQDLSEIDSSESSCDSD